MYKVKRFASVREMKKVTKKMLDNMDNIPALKKIAGRSTTFGSKTSAKLAKDEALRKISVVTAKKMGVKPSKSELDAMVDAGKNALSDVRARSVKVGGRMKKFEDALASGSPF